MTIFFSLHALQRMHERGYDRDDVLDVIREPEYTYTREMTDIHGTVFVGADIVVVTEDPTPLHCERRVLTVAPRESGTQTSRPLNKEAL